MRYKLTFNYYGETIILWTHAKDERQAFSRCVIRLAKRLEVVRVRLYNYFCSGDRYLIEEKEESK